MVPCGHNTKNPWKALSFVSNLTYTLRAIVRSSEKFEVRILRPVEFEKIRDAMDPYTRRICTSLLLTGMRYAELQRFRENPDWLDGKFVYLPRGSMLKVKAKQRERANKMVPAAISSSQIRLISTPPPISSSLYDHHPQTG